MVAPLDVLELFSARGSFVCLQSSYLALNWFKFLIILLFQFHPISTISSLVICHKSYLQDQEESIILWGIHRRGPNHWHTTTVSFLITFVLFVLRLLILALRLL